VRTSVAAERRVVRHALTEANLLLAPHRADHPAALLGPLLARSQALLAEMTGEFGRLRELTNERGQVVRDLRSVTDDFKRGAAAVLQPTARLARTWQDTASRITALTAAMQEMARAQAGTAADLRQTRDDVQRLLREQEATSGATRRAFEELA